MWIGRFFWADSFADRVAHSLEESRVAEFLANKITLLLGAAFQSFPPLLAMLSLGSALIAAAVSVFIVRETGDLPGDFKRDSYRKALLA